MMQLTLLIKFTERVRVLIEIKGVTKKYGDYTAIENVNITVEDSSVYGIAGFNGCGKTTLLNVCAGVFKAEEGAVFLDGADAFDNSKERKEMFYLTDDTWFPAKNSVLSSAKYYAEYFPNFDFDVLQEVCDLFGLNSKANIKSLSKGMKKQAGLAIAFAASPKYLLIDETFDGLDPHKREILRKLLLEYINTTGASVVISSHNLADISDLCDHIAIINGKSVILNCAIEDISEHYRRVYLTFENPINEGLFKGVNYRKCELTERTATLLICGDVEKEIEKLSALGAENMKTELLTLEEVFSEETEAITDDGKIKSIFNKKRI